MRSEWLPIEDYRLFKIIKEQEGHKKWTSLAYYFKNRNENAIKNRYQLILHKIMKKKTKNRNKSDLQLVD